MTELSNINNNTSTHVNTLKRHNKARADGGLGLVAPMFSTYGLADCRGQLLHDAGLLA